MGVVHFSTLEAPLYIFTLEGEMTYSAVSDHLRDYKSIVDRGRPYVVLFDARSAGSSDARVRKLYAEFLNASTPDIRLLCKGGAFIVTSSLIKGALTAVLWLAPLPFPHRTFTSIDEGRSWLLGLL